jgi:hypothetical protein
MYPIPAVVDRSVGRLAAPINHRLPAGANELIRSGGMSPRHPVDQLQNSGDGRFGGADRLAPLAFLAHTCWVLGEDTYADTLIEALSPPPARAVRVGSLIGWWGPVDHHIASLCFLAGRLTCPRATASGARDRAVHGGSSFCGPDLGTIGSGYGTHRGTGVGHRAGVRHGGGPRPSERPGSRPRSRRRDQPADCPSRQ